MKFIIKDRTLVWKMSFEEFIIEMSKKFQMILNIVLVPKMGIMIGTHLKVLMNL